LTRWPLRATLWLRNCSGYALLLQHTEQLSVRAAVLKAAAIRLRPRVMVSVAILIGLMPLALALEAGGEMLQPMAIAAIGGLLMEMLVSLFLMQCLYLMATREV
jgi:multidrug efflux pump subunit AcrB